MPSLILTVLLVLSVTFVHGDSTSGSVLKSDLKYIRCDVCTKVATSLWTSVENMKAKVPKRALDELDILGVLESVCNPKNASGHWIRTSDIYIDSTITGDYLRIAEPGGQSRCGSECKTLAKSCDTLLEDEIESQDDLLALLWAPATKQTKVEVLWRALFWTCW
jgi:hypothetical protein